MLEKTYQALAPLAQGAESVILEARCRTDERKVALKLAKAPPTLELLDRLAREVDLSRRLAHPGLVALVEAGMFDGRACQVMELIDGWPLNRVLEDGPLPAEIGAAILRDLAAVLARLHAAGVVHRDVKPGNIILRSDFSPVLVDLGAAALTPAEMAPGTDLVGCPSTLAPEIVADLPADGRADVYSLGRVAQRMLPKSPPALAAIVAACLADDPLDRPTARRLHLMLSAHHP